MTANVPPLRLGAGTFVAAALCLVLGGMAACSSVGKGSPADRTSLGDLPARPGAVGAEMPKPTAAESQQKDAHPAPGKTVVYLSPVWEPNERAFTHLLPRGWTAEGGVFRANPATANGPMNALNPKVDYKLRREPAGRVMMHYMPIVFYKDPRFLMGGWPPGKPYMGMMVAPAMDAVTFLERWVFPSTHQSAANVQVVERRPMPKLIEKYHRMYPQGVQSGIQYQAMVVTVVYDEDGVRYREKMTTGIENQGQIGLGMWRNLDTLRVRAPDAEFDSVAPLFALIQSSSKANPQWEAAEQRGQMQRANSWRQLQNYEQKTYQQILDHRRQTYSEIANDMYLFMSNQEEYVNPYTGEVEVGSNQWKHRWQSEMGDVVYTDDPNYDPNWDSARTRSDFKRSEVRPRP